MKKYIYLVVLFLGAFSPDILNGQERVFEDTIAGFRIDRRKNTDNGGQIIISVRETESGSIKGGDPPYPYSYTVSMRFEGRIINSKDKFRLIPNLTDNLRSLAMKEECTLIAELEPVEESMKVEKWECSDPANNSPSIPLLTASPPNFFIPVRIWQIGKKIYITHGFIDGIHGYFVSWDDPRAKNKKEPFGVRPDGTMGCMGEYIEVPYDKLTKGETIVLHPKDVSDHNDDDVWQWKTAWTVLIHPS
ncbi:MAG: hypothetical protein JW965_01610 [Bacteroidales bacterium]|nr:hypothetical protein [Bacteroidales bacterium]